MRLLNGIKAKVNLLPLNEAAGHSVRAPVGRAREPLRADPRGARRHGVGPQVPRPRHPRRVRSADHRIGRDQHAPGQRLATLMQR